MNNCNKFQDLILTDYLDGELDLEIKKQVECHLQECASCRDLFVEVSRNMTTPFTGLQREAVPEHIWTSIKSKIEEEWSSQNPLRDLVEKLTKAISFPKFVPALTSLVLLIIVSSLVVYNQQLKQSTTQEEVEYLNYVFNVMDVQSDNENLGTSIEQYFL